MWISRLYWIAVALATAVAAHAAFALFVPAYWFSQRIDRISGDKGENNFFILSPKDQAGLLPGLPRNGVTGVCVFDVSKGDVTLSADLPDGLWVTTIYTDRGESIYSVNNRQSGSNVFNVTLSLAPGFIDMLIQATDKERPEIDSGWTVMSPQPRGLAVVWYPLPDMALRTVTAESIARTRCIPGAVSPSQ
jgi:uncharacterized membrane protein